MCARSECGRKSAAIAYTPVVMAQACMADALSCIDDHKITRIDEPLPWRYAAKTA